MHTNILFGPFDQNTFHRSPEKITLYIVTPAVNAKHVTTVTGYYESHHACTHSLWVVSHLHTNAL